MIGLPEYAPAEMATVSRYLLIANSALNPILCIMLTKDYYCTVKRIINQAVQTRIGKRYIFVPTSTHFIRRNAV